VEVGTLNGNYCNADTLDSHSDPDPSKNAHGHPITGESLRYPSDKGGAALNSVSREDAPTTAPEAEAQANIAEAPQSTPGLERKQNNPESSGTRRGHCWSQGEDLYSNSTPNSIAICALVSGSCDKTEGLLESAIGVLRFLFPRSPHHPPSRHHRRTALLDQSRRCSFLAASLHFLLFF